MNLIEYLNREDFSLKSLNIYLGVKKQKKN